MKKHALVLNGALNYSNGFFNHLVSNFVIVIVINGLEVIKVKKDDRNGTVIGVERALMSLGRPYDLGHQTC